MHVLLISVFAVCFLGLRWTVFLTCVSLQPPLPQTGMGRLCTLDEPASLATMIERIKRHLKLAHVRLALGVGRTLGKYDPFICAVYLLIM